MRSYIRHPSDIPIEVGNKETAFNETECLKNVSFGGLSFNSGHPLKVGTAFIIRIPVVRPIFEALSRVTWCNKVDNHYEVGVEFLNQQDLFRVRMVEQICHIEHYKNEVFVKEGRNLTGQEAAMEWIDKYANDFPHLENVAEG